MPGRKVSIWKVSVSTTVPLLSKIATTPRGFASTLPVFPTWTITFWKPRVPPVVTLPIAKDTTGGPGTFTCTATIVRSRIRIWTRAICPGFCVASWREVSATMPATHCPARARAGT